MTKIHDFKSKLNLLSNVLEKKSAYCTLLVRIGISGVFLWFGIDKFFHPTNWSAWVPPWIGSLVPISLITFMYVQGVFETITGCLLLVGYKTRFAAFLAVLTLGGVALAMLGTGQTEVMLRDAGLLAASLSLLLSGSSCFCINSIKKKKKLKNI